ncbi:hypothetical protein BDV12DRAFT_196459 [Aspergillus spectabilis]
MKQVSNSAKADLKKLLHAIQSEQLEAIQAVKGVNQSQQLSVFARTAVLSHHTSSSAANTDPPVPQRDKILADKQDLTVGDVTFHVVLTPGHTLGTLSLVFPVVDHGSAVAGLSGGTGTSRDAPSGRKKSNHNIGLGKYAKTEGLIRSSPITKLQTTHCGMRTFWHIGNPGRLTRS